MQCQYSQQATIISFIRRKLTDSLGNTYKRRDALVLTQRIKVITYEYH